MIKHLEINTDKINKTTKFLLISDLHQSINNKNDNLKRLKNKLQEEFKDIDYILIVGDIIENGNYLFNSDFRKELIENMKEFTEGKETYYVFGNHDITKKHHNYQLEMDENELKKVLKKLDNFHCVDNNKVYSFDNISIMGFNPDLRYYLESQGSQEEFKRQFYEKYNKNPFNKETFNIFLTHDPCSIINLSKEINECIQPNTDIVISGHMHNGLMPNILQNITNHRGIVGPYNTKFPKYAHGVLDIGDTKYLILGPVNTYIKSRFINKMYSPEAYILTINQKEKTKTK